MKNLLYLLSILVFFSCAQPQKTETNSDKAPADFSVEKKQIAAMLDSFNVAAARSDYQHYFSFYTRDAVFAGTDATENWNKDAFMIWAKPHFDKKKTWDFTAVQRNIYFGRHPDIAWFDELLKTGMKICRGSGVVVKENGEWKVQQYILSMTVPNEKMDEVLKLKGPIEDSLLTVLENK